MHTAVRSNYIDKLAAVIFTKLNLLWQLYAIADLSVIVVNMKRFGH